MDCVYSNIGTIHNRPWVLSHPQVRIWNWWILVRVVFVQDVWVCTVSCSPTFGRNSVSFGTFLHIISLELLSKPQREKTLKQYIYYMILHGQNIMILYGQNIYIYSIFSHPFKKWSCSRNAGSSWIFSCTSKSPLTLWLVCALRTMQSNSIVGRNRTTSPCLPPALCECWYSR